MKYDLIIFDCDGVLVDSEGLSTRVVAEAARNLGVDLSNAAALELFSGTSLNFCMEYIEKRSGKPIPHDFEAQYRKRSFELFEQELEAVEGIKEIVEGLQIPFCVASNGPAYKVEFNLKLTEMYHHFEGKVFSAYDIKRWKPDPELFLEAARIMGASAERCLVVEDSLAGVKAGVAAKMDVIAYTHNGQEEILKNAGAKTIKKMRELEWLI